MPHPVTLAALAFWCTAVALALLGSDLSANAGLLPHGLGNIAMLAGLAHVAIVIAGVWFLSPRWPRIVVRLVQLVGMAGAFWSAGTITRAVYALWTGAPDGDP